MLNFIHTQREITNAGGSVNNDGLRCIAMLEQQVKSPHPDNPTLIPGTNQQGNDGNANANPSGRGNHPTSDTVAIDRIDSRSASGIAVGGPSVLLFRSCSHLLQLEVTFGLLHLSILVSA
jgi:hypothetical protein